MTPPAGRAVLSGRVQNAAGQGEDRAAAFDAGPVWMRVLPPVVMLAMALWRITGPSYWRDEAATLTATARPFGELLRMLGHVDAVHGVYYMIIWVVVRAGGTGELATRLPSAVAMACAAAAVAALGRRLVSPGAGLAAGLLFAVLPQISFYAQDARDYALVTALAATASYLLVRALTAAGRRIGWLTGYGACLGVMGDLNVFSLLLVGAHAVTVALAWRRAGRSKRGELAGRGELGGSAELGGGGELGGSAELGGRVGAGQTMWPVTVGWLAAVAGALLLASPVLVLGIAQRGRLSWLTTPPLLGAIEGLRKLIGPAPMLVVLCLAVGLGIFISLLAGRPLRASWPPELFALCLPWLLLPAAVLIGVSYASPVYTFRYILFCAPAAALLAGTGLAALNWPPGGMAAWVPATVTLAVVAAFGLPAQLAARSPDGHGTNIRAANAIVAAARRPGDAVVYLGTDSKYFPAAYPSGFARLDDIAQARTPSQAGNLVGSPVRASVVRHRLARVRRVWLVKLGDYPHDLLLAELHFRLVRRWRVSDIWLVLFARGQAG
jgi:mannosyltransferase